MSSSPLETTDDKHAALRKTLLEDSKANIEGQIWGHALDLITPSDQLNVLEMAFGLDRRPLIVKALRETADRLERLCGVEPK